MDRAGGFVMLENQPVILENWPLILETSTLDFDNSNP